MQVRHLRPKLYYPMYIPCHQVSLFCMFSVIHWLLSSSQHISLPRNPAHHLCCSYKLTRFHLLGKTSLKKRTETMKMWSPKQSNDKKNKLCWKSLKHTHDFGCNVWQVQVIFDIPRRGRIQLEIYFVLKMEIFKKQKFENNYHSCHILTQS